MKFGHFLLNLAIRSSHERCFWFYLEFWVPSPPPKKTLLLANFLQNCVEHFAEFSLSGSNDLQEEKESPTVYGSKDNRELMDNNTAQSLTGEDIDELRRLELLSIFYNH